MGDFSTTSLVQNRTIVCGAFTSSSSALFATHTNHNPFPAMNPTLQILGHLVDGDTINITTGSMGLGCLEDRTIMTGLIPNQYFIDGRIINLNDGDDEARPYLNYTLQARCETITTEINHLSTFLSEQSTTVGNQIEILSDQQMNRLIIHINQINCNGIAIIHVHADELFSSSSIQSIDIQTSRTDINLLVINVDGIHIHSSKNITIENNTWMTTFGNEHTIWNFFQAQSLILSQQFFGTILAPKANVTTDQPITGSIACHSLITTNEIQLPTIILPSCI